MMTPIAATGTGPQELPRQSARARWSDIVRLLAVLASLVFPMIFAGDAIADPATLVFPRPIAATADLPAMIPANNNAALATTSLAADLDSVAFGRVVAELDNFALMPDWRDVLRRAKAEDALCRKACGGTAWRQLIATLRELPRARQLDAVQQQLNRLPYRDDEANWHRLDYWETPKQFLAKGGDCEDFAIAKYFALRAAGWPDNDVRVMLSHRRGDSVGHAYLLARGPEGWLVLDNRAVLPYRPNSPIDGLWAGYSLNESSLWIHRNFAAPDFVVSSRQ